MPVLSDGTKVRVRAPSSINRVRPPSNRVKAVVVRGPKGDDGTPGVSGNFGFETKITEPASTWIIDVPVEFGRTPAVTVLVDGAIAVADVIADETTVTVIHSVPTTGSVILT